MTQKPTINMRGLEKVFMVEVLEGKGTQDDPSRIVRYFFEENGEYIGEIDPVNE